MQRRAEVTLEKAKVDLWMEEERCFAKADWRVVKAFRSSPKFTQEKVVFFRETFFLR